MASIVRWDPFREMVSLRDAMDQLFDNSFLGAAPRDTEAGWAMPLDVTEGDTDFVVKASLPGINPDDLEITVVDNMLTVTGEVHADEEKKDHRYHLRERRWGKFSRSVTLPTMVDADNVQAEYLHGVLTLTLPKHEQVRPHRITIRATDGKTIEGQAQS